MTEKYFDITGSNNVGAYINNIDLNYLNQGLIKEIKKT